MKARSKPFLLIYLLLWSIAFVVLVLMLRRGDRSLAESAVFFIEMATNTTFLIGFHCFFLLCYGLFLVGRYFIGVYRTKGSRTFWKRFSYRFALPLVLVFMAYKTLVYANGYEAYTYEWNATVHNGSGHVNNWYETDKKHRGLSVFGWSEDNDAAIADLVRANVEWVAVIPFLYQKDETTKLIESRENPNVYTRRDSNFIKTIRQLRENGLRVHLKPHLWMNSGWRSNITLATDAEWEAWFASYRSHMLRYARMAEETKAELFCLGTELRTSIKKQPEKWVALIEAIKNIYSGELTYAANWYDEYEHIAFWDKLDYIGIQAYFPLTTDENPDLATIEQGWNKHLNALKRLHETYGKPILFTEVGYKSEAGATIKPWEWSSLLSGLTKQKSHKTQQLAYEALFNTVWQQPWSAGVYIWQWDLRTTEESAENDLDFSPRYKPAENVMTKWFGKKSYTSPK